MNLSKGLIDAAREILTDGNVISRKRDSLLEAAGVRSVKELPDAERKELEATMEAFIADIETSKKKKNVPTA